MSATARRPGPGNREWFNIKQKAGNTAEVFIFDEIGEGYFGGGVCAEDFINGVKSVGLTKNDTLVTHINSPGGNMFDGFAIYNFLRAAPFKTVMRIEGVAASAASLIAMAGDRVEMPANSMQLIHNPWMGAVGDYRAMMKAADDLRSMRDSAVGTYMRKCGDKVAKSELMKMLDDETWVNAEDCVKYGLADVVDEPVRASNLAQFDFGRYGFPVPKQMATAALRAELERLKN